MFTVPFLDIENGGAYNIFKNPTKENEVMSKLTSVLIGTAVVAGAAAAFALAPAKADKDKKAPFLGR